MRRSPRASSSFRTWIVIAVAAAIAFAMPLSSRWTAHADSLAGSQGTDTSLPTDKDSTVTVPGRGAFKSLAVTVNETKNLVNQAIDIKWTGASPTFSDDTTHAFGNAFSGDYLQIFQCWGDPDPTDPLNAVNPGPAPTQCQFGGESNTPTSAYPIKDTGFEYSRVLSQDSWTNYPSSPGWVDTTTGYKIEPFQSVDGTVVNQQADYNSAFDQAHPKPFWLEPYFSFNTTNEIPFARTYPDASGNLGHGEQLFQVQTGLEAPGLGCGQALQQTAAGKKRPQCWLVVVPRGAPADENPAGVSGLSSVVTSPLAPAAWANRIAIPLGFKPVDSTCPIGTDERRIVGSELAVAAITSWQPALCATKNSPPYSYSYLSDDRARENLTQQGFGGAGMSVFTQPPDKSTLDPKNPAVVAPLTLSGEVIGFNIERAPTLGSDGQPNAEENPLSGIRVQHLQLTPRLVAKLLTQSYQAQLVDVLATKPAKYSWALKNPATIVDDPDFLRFNPEFALLTTKQAVDASGLVVEEPTSDAATALWKWVLADPEAKQWLDGTPDEWGMVANPIYSTTAAHNVNGVAFGKPAPNSFPKADPYCYDTQTPVGSTGQPARPICILDWSPYTLTMQAAARAGGSANSGAKTTLDPTATPETAWAANGPQRAGLRFIMSVTDSPSAARYGLQTAGLSRAGDDGTSRSFITADDSALLAGVKAMKPTGSTHQLVSDPSTNAPGAYPLTLLTYAGATPLSLDATSRRDYAAFVKYATSTGQAPGVGAGQLPVGYVPLPSALRAQAATAVNSILHMQSPPAHTTTTTTQPTAQSHTTPTVPLPASVVDDPGFTDTSGDGGFTSPTDGSSPVTPTATPNTPVKSVQLIESSAVTKGIEGGAVRFALPILLLIGLLALGSAFRKPKRRPAFASAGAPLEPEAPAPPELAPSPSPASAPASAPASDPVPPPPGRPSAFDPW